MTLFCNIDHEEAWMRQITSDCVWSDPAPEVMEVTYWRIVLLKILFVYFLFISFIFYYIRLDCFTIIIKVNVRLNCSFLIAM